MGTCVKWTSGVNVFRVWAHMNASGQVVRLCLKYGRIYADGMCGVSVFRVYAHTLSERVILRCSEFRLYVKWYECV